MWVFQAILFVASCLGTGSRGIQSCECLAKDVYVKPVKRFFSVSPDTEYVSQTKLLWAHNSSRNEIHNSPNSMRDLSHLK